MKRINPEKRLLFESLAIIAAVIIGKTVFKIQKNILLFFALSAFFCILDIIANLDVSDTKEEQVEVTDIMILHIKNIKKERKKFLILEGLILIINLACNWNINVYSWSILALNLIISLYLWMKFYLKTIPDNNQYPMKAGECWLYFHAMPIIYTIQFVLCLFESFEL